MPIAAHSVATTQPDSCQTAGTVAQDIQEQLGPDAKLVVVYLTLNHEQEGFIGQLATRLGPGVSIVGCSAQGIVGSGLVREEGYGAAVLALGGAGLHVATAHVEQIEAAPRRQGEALGRALAAQLSSPAKCIVLHYDALGGVEVDELLLGLHGALPAPIIGGASADRLDYGFTRQTYQYHQHHVLRGSAVAFALTGDFSVEYDVCHGCSPVGVEMVVTKSAGNVLLELDGRPASQVWNEICPGPGNQLPHLAIGVPVVRASGPHNYLIRAAYSLDDTTGGVVLGPAIPPGTRIMLHHRTTADVLDGARSMGHALRQRLVGKRPRAVLGFECGARTRPFLGDAATQAENLELQQTLGADIPWAGAMVWGELFPIGDKPGFHNYTYPLLVLTE